MLNISSLIFILTVLSTSFDVPIQLCQCIDCEDQYLSIDHFANETSWEWKNDLLIGMTDQANDSDTSVHLT